LRTEPTPKENAMSRTITTPTTVRAAYVALHRAHRNALHGHYTTLRNLREVLPALSRLGGELVGRIDDAAAFATKGWWPGHTMGRTARERHAYALAAVALCRNQAPRTAPVTHRAAGTYLADMRASAAVWQPLPV
jgi:hypothetical protein